MTASKTIDSKLYINFIKIICSINTAGDFY